MDELDANLQAISDNLVSINRMVDKLPTKAWVVGMTIASIVVAIITVILQPQLQALFGVHG